MTPQDLHLAYIDPGAGSILIQVIIGTLLAVPYFLRRQIGRAYSAVRRRKPASEQDRRNDTTPSER
jgi:hypothetical protein